MNEPRRQITDLLLTSYEAQQQSPQEASPRGVAPTASSTTTFTSTQLTSAHVGCLCVWEDGAAKGMWRLIKSVAAGVATIYGAAWPTPTGGTMVRLYTCPDTPVVADSGTTTTTVDAAHLGIANEPDDYFNGDVLLAIGGANAGEAVLISDFVAATGTFTHGAFSNAVAAGHLMIIVTPLRIEGPITATIDRKTLQRRNPGNADADHGVVLTASGSVEFEEAQKPLLTAAGDATPAVPPYQSGRLLRDICDQTLDTGSTYVSQTGAAPGGVVLTVASGTGFSVGGFVLTSAGEMSLIKDKATNALTTPHLTAAALIASSAVYASASYKRKAFGVDCRTRSFPIWRGRLHHQRFHGCMPTREITVSRDQVVKFAWKYMAPDAFEWAAPDPNTVTTKRIPVTDTTVPVDGKMARFMIDSIPVIIGDLKINQGFKPVVRPSISGPNQADGCFMDLDVIHGTVTGYMADNDDISAYTDMCDRLALGRTVDIFLQKGSAPTKAYGLAVPYAFITKAPATMNNGALEFTFEFDAVNPMYAEGSTANQLLQAMHEGWA